MKKTTLLLLTSCALAGCYTAPEMTENKYRDFYSDTSVCGTSTMYQNQKLRECIENRLAEDEKNKKTVSILPLENGDTLVVPKTADDAKLKDTTRVYEIVDIRENAPVVVEEGNSTEIQQEEVTDNIVVEEDTTKPVETTETTAVVETLIEQAPIVEEAEQFEEPKDADTFIELEESSEVIVETNDEETTSQNAADGVTLVVGPLKEDLVIEVKSAGEKKKTVEKKTTKTQTKTVQTPIKKSFSAEEIEQQRKERIEQARKRAEERRMQKKQKEVLPIEEK